MRNGGGRAKGAGFENEIAKLIRAVAVEYGFADDCCYRTPSSGGHRFAKKSDPGDLVVSPKLAKYFPFHIECKKQEIFELMHLLALPSIRMDSWAEFQWITQSIEAVKAAKPLRPPMVVCTKNRFPIYAIVDEREWHKWNNGFLEIPSHKPPMPHSKFLYVGQTWLLMPFDYVLLRLKRSLSRKTK